MSRPVLVDTHAHLMLDRFDPDREAVLRRAQEAGVAAVVNIGFDLETAEGAIRLAEVYPSCWATVGLHPHEAERWGPALAERLRKLAEHPKAIAIGEAGLDYYRNRSPRERQVEALIGQIQLARELSLPLVVHNREATEDLLNLIEAYADGVPVLLHCFSDDRSAMERAAALGCFFGLGGPVTYPRSEALREAVAAMPADRILLETDAPWLPPQPVRGKRNEPAYVRFTAEVVAQVRREPVAVLARRSTQNAERFFGRRLIPPDHSEDGSWNAGSS
ncbi:MAG: hydrolase TatD [Candidatus Poribacteria bacterium]|nr:MAG: hydrolase TatD [Candidatus Poribacteria bacterium]